MTVESHDPPSVYRESDPDGETVLDLEECEAVKVRYSSPHANGPKTAQGILRRIDSVSGTRYAPTGDPELWIDATDRESWLVLWPTRNEVRAANDSQVEADRPGQRIGDLERLAPLF